MKELKERLKKREEILKDSITRMRGIVEFDRERVEADEKILAEINGRVMEIRQILKELEEK